MRIGFRLGFWVDPAINYMFRRAVMDLVKAKKVDTTSRYTSLRDLDAGNNLQFVLLNRTPPHAQSLSGWQRLVARLAGLLRQLGASQQESFGLGNPSVTLKNIHFRTPKGLRQR